MCGESTEYAPVPVLLSETPNSPVDVPRMPDATIAEEDRSGSNGIEQRETVSPAERHCSDALVEYRGALEVDAQRSSLAVATSILAAASRNGILLELIRLAFVTWQMLDFSG